MRGTKHLLQNHEGYWMEQRGQPLTGHSFVLPALDCMLLSFLKISDLVALGFWTSLFPGPEFHRRFLGSLPGGGRTVPISTIMSPLGNLGYCLRSQGTEVPEVKHLALELQERFGMSTEKVKNTDTVYVVGWNRSIIYISMEHPFQCIFQFTGYYYTKYVQHILTYKYKYVNI